MLTGLGLSVSSMSWASLPLPILSPGTSVLRWIRPVEMIHNQLLVPTPFCQAPPLVAGVWKEVLKQKGHKRMGRLPAEGREA